MRATATRASELKEMLDKCVGINQHSRPERIGMEQVWATAALYFKGIQRFEWIDGRVVNRGYVDDDQARYKVNLLAARLISACARVLNTNGEFDVRPPRADAKTREFAALSARVFEHIREITDFEWQSINSTISKALYGTSIYKIRWNPLIGDPTRYYWNDKQSKVVIPQDMLTDDQIQAKTAQGLFEDHSPGDVDISVLSPFTFFPDWSARGEGIAGCQWAAEKHYVDIDVLAERWDKDPKDFKPTETTQSLLNYEDAMQAASAGSWMTPFSYTIPKDKQRTRTLYIELWHRPCAAYPKGLRVCWTPDMILNDDDVDNPYVADKTKWSHLPYVADYWVEDPTRFWGKSLAEDMVTPQFYLNEMRSQKIMFARIHGLPNTYIDKQAGLDTGNMAAGGKIYGVDRQGSNNPVSTGGVPQMPEAIAVLDNLIVSDLNAVASSSEVEGDSLPGQLRSGAAISQINQDRFMGLSIPARNTLRACRDSGRISLALGKMYYPSNRLMTFLGEGNEWVVEEFSGANLLNDVVIVGTPSVMDTPQAREQKMMDAIAAGALNPQFDSETKALIWSAMEFKTGDEFVQKRLGAKRACEREIQAILADPAKYAQGYPVFDWQDHDIYCATLKAFFYTPEFEKLEPDTQAILSTNFAQHQQIIEQQQMKALQMQEAIKGAPGQPGQASQPRAK